MGKYIEYWLIRHGESLGNIDPETYYKMPDHLIPLTMDGINQSLEMGKRLNSHFLKFKKIFFITIWYSPYLRTVQTKDMILSQIDKNIDVELKECPLIYEREWGELRELINDKENKDKYFNFYFRPNGGESFLDLYKRVVSFHQEVILNESRFNVVISHGEFLKCFLMKLKNISVKDFNSIENFKNCEEVIQTEYSPI